eukprot:719209-Lingulodinium_polyedra.AAC.1
MPAGNPPCAVPVRPGTDGRDCENAMRLRCRPAADQRAACRSAGVNLKFASSLRVSLRWSH